MPFLFVVQARYQFYQYFKLPSRWQLLSLAFTHSVGLCAAYKGLVEGKVSLVQTMKAIEPLIAICFSAFFLKIFPKFDYYGSHNPLYLCAIASAASPTRIRSL